MKRLTTSAFFLLFCTLLAFAQKKTRLPDPINLWDYDEYAPSISADGKTLIFQSERYGVLVSGINKVPEIDSEGHKNRVLNKGSASFFGIYETQLHPGGQWSPPKPIESINRFSKSLTPVMGGPSISYDGNFLYFFANFPDDKNSYGREDIYYSIREKYGWSQPINLGSTINTPGYEGFPSISADGKQLYFIREDLTKKAQGEERCYIIMRSEKGFDGNWKRPIEMPAPINMDCEKAPRIMADSKTLIYSSIKKKGKGNFDLYLSRLKDNGGWTDPEPLDFINTKHADQSVAISACGEEMYFISNGDIYTIPIPDELRPQKMMTIQGFVVDSKSTEPVATQVILRDKKTDKVISTIDTNPFDGRYTLLAPHGSVYEVEVIEKGYKPEFAKLDLQNINHCEILETDFKLESREQMARRTGITIEEEPVITQLEKTPKRISNEEAPPAEIKTEEAVAKQEKPIEIKAEPEKKEDTQSREFETEVIASQRRAPKVVSIIEEEKADLSRDNKTFTDKLKEEQKATISGETKPSGYVFSLLVRDGDNNSAIKDVSINAPGLDFKFDSERNSYEANIQETDRYKIGITAPGYQSEEYVIQGIGSNKQVVVHLLADLPTQLTITVTDLSTNKALASKIKMIKESGEILDMDNPTGKTTMEFTKNEKLKFMVEAEGYTSIEKTLDIEIDPDGKIYQFDAKLDKIKYAILAQAIDKETEKPIDQAIFSLNQKENTTKYEGILSNNIYNYAIPGEGNYTIEVQAEGYQSQFIDLKVDKNITEVIFEMVQEVIPFKEITFVVRDFYTRAPLNGKILIGNRKYDSLEKVKVEEGEDIETLLLVDGYPDFKTTLSLRSPDRFEIELKKGFYPFRFRVISETDRRTLSEARINIFEEKTRDKAQFEVRNGIAQAQLDPELSYQVAVSAPGYRNTQEKFSPLQSLYDNLREKVIALSPEERMPAQTSANETVERIETKEFGTIEKGKSVQLNNIYFDQSSPVLKTESFEELNNLSELLKENPGFNMEVRGFTDNQGDFNKNIQLSRDRCMAVIEYLIGTGIEKTRLTAVGRGPLDPVAPNNTEENRSKNRRVEFVLL